MKSKIIVALLVFTACFFWPVQGFENWDDWHTRYAVALWCGGFGISYLMYLRFGWELALTTLLVCTNSVWTFAWRANHIAGESVGTRVLLNNVSQTHLISYLLLMVPWVGFSRKEFELVGKVFGYLCGLCSALIILFGLDGSPGILHGTGSGGLFNNPSMAGCFIAVTYPLLLEHLPRKLFLWPVIPLIAIYILGVSQPFGVLAIVVGAMLFSAYGGRLTLRHYGLLCVSLVTLTCLGFFFCGRNDFFNTNGRSAFWSMVFEWWFANANQFFGTGAGTAFIMAPRIQLEHHFNIGSYYIWMHSDWLQVLFEYGWLGFTALLAVVTSALRKAWGRPELFAVACGYAAMAMANDPGRLGLHAILGAWIMTNILQKELTNNQL